MATRTERMEMRLDPETVGRVDNWRMGQEDIPSRSEAARRLIERGLQAHTPEGFRPSKTERLMTWMLSEILKNQLTPPKDIDSKHDMKTVNLIQEALYGGHFWALDWQMTGVMHNEADDPQAVREVVNILDTWSFIERAYADFNDEEKQRVEAGVEYRGKNPKFLGFDGNNETEYMSIVRFLVEELGRFESFKGRDFNSHMPTVARYRKMAAVFEPMRTSLVGRELNPSEVIRLLKID